MLHCVVRQPLSTLPSQKVSSFSRGATAEKDTCGYGGATFGRKGQLRECWHPEFEARPTREHMQMQCVGTNVHKPTHFAWFSESSQ